MGVARALAAGPQVVLMDEPFGALDPLTRDAVAQTIAAAQRARPDHGDDPHDMLEAVLLADRIAILHDGKLIEQGTPHKLMTAAEHDYVRSLMQAPRKQADRLQSLMRCGR